VAKATPSAAAQRKITRKHTDPAEDAPLPVHSFHMQKSGLDPTGTVARSANRVDE
jgi:hypothetical protein